MGSNNGAARVIGFLEFRKKLNSENGWGAYYVRWDEEMRSWMVEEPI